MALTPQKQIKRLAIGTALSLFFILLMTIFSQSLSSWQFYLLVMLLLASILYAIPGYIGIWMWRMRNFFFDLN